MNSPQPFIQEHLLSDPETLIKKHERTFKKYASSICLKNGIPPEHTADIYQESIIALLQNIRRNGFTLTAQLTSYFYAICKRQAVKFLSKYWKELPAAEGVTESFADWHGGVALDNASYLREQTIVARVQALLPQLTPSCRETLMMYYVDESSMEEIAQRFGYSNTDVAKTKKYKCLKCLEKLLKENDRKLLHK